jgi:hypothetical protein
MDNLLIFPSRSLIRVSLFMLVVVVLATDRRDDEAITEPARS